MVLSLDLLDVFEDWACVYEVSVVASSAHVPGPEAGVVWCDGVHTGFEEGRIIRGPVLGLFALLVLAGRVFPDVHGAYDACVGLFFG